MAEKKDFLNSEKLVEHIDIKKYNVVELVDAMGKMAFQASKRFNASKLFFKFLSIINQT